MHQHDIPAFYLSINVKKNNHKIDPSRHQEMANEERTESFLSWSLAGPETTIQADEGSWHGQGSGGYR